jgi:hypothetical protein
MVLGQVILVTGQRRLVFCGRAFVLADAISIQPAPLAATDETKRLRQVQINMVSFVFCMWVAG